jgi:hypothetical protein
MFDFRSLSIAPAATVPAAIASVGRFTDTCTLTFGDQGENHVGMQKIGEFATEGFKCEELLQAQRMFEARGYKCEYIVLNDVLDVPSSIETASVLIIRNGVSYFLKDGADGLYAEQRGLTPDTKAFMYGRVVNKHARHNLCFSETAQEPNYAAGLGRIVAYSEVPLLQRLKLGLPNVLGDKAKQLIVEGNYYYDLRKCGIGFHGDAERRKVVAVRLGATMPFHYQWFLRRKPVGPRIKLSFNHGDMYVMSEKAVGTDWRKSSILTLRHAAGCEKFLTIK